MSETTQLADFDPELAEELEVYDEMVEGEQCTGIVESVTSTNTDDWDRIKVVVTLPWNDTVERSFKRPKDDPGGEFQQFVESIGYRLNSAKEIIGEEVPCEYGGSQWHLVIPESRWKRIGEMVVGTWQASNDMLFGRTEKGWVKALRGVSYLAGWALLAPVFHFFLWMWLIKRDQRKLDKTMPALVGGGILYVLFTFIWAILAHDVYTGVIA